MHTNLIFFPLILLYAKYKILDNHSKSGYKIFNLISNLDANFNHAANSYVILCTITVTIKMVREVSDRIKWSFSIPNKSNKKELSELKEIYVKL